MSASDIPYLIHVGAEHPVLIRNISARSSARKRPATF